MFTLRGMSLKMPSSRKAIEQNEESMMQIYLSRPDITDREIQSVVEVLRGPNLALGPKLTEFEEAFARYLGRRRAIAVNSGTSGLFLSLLALGIGAGALISVWCVRLVASLLYGVQAMDPLTFGGMAVVLLAVAAVAGLLPAVRAARTRGTRALQAD